jgi:hypothetical protein
MGAPGAGDPTEDAARGPRLLLLLLPLAPLPLVLQDRRGRTSASMTVVLVTVLSTLRRNPAGSGVEGRP